MEGAVAGPSKIIAVNGSQPKKSQEKRRKERSLPTPATKITLNNHSIQLASNVEGDEGAADDAWICRPLAATSSFVCPVVFNADCSFAFIAIGAAVKIYSVATVELLSTIVPPRIKGASNESLTGRHGQVSCMLLNPSSPMQLLVGSLDGLIRVWDYVEGKLLRTLDMGSAVLSACGHKAFPDQLFVCLEAETDGAATVEYADNQERLAGIYAVSLRPQITTNNLQIDPATPRLPSRRVRLAQPRVVRSLGISPLGDYLISLNAKTVNICRTALLEKGFTVHLDSPEQLTCLAFHPNENYFATGSRKGLIRLWYGVMPDHDISSSSSAAIKSSTAVLHWHANAVSALAFTPNGAFLLSGGEEAVMVLWQLHTGHQEYVPRLGSPVDTLSIADMPNAEQQVAARLRDGSVVFIGSQKLKISKTIIGVKTNSITFAPHQNHTKAYIPLTTDAVTKSLVLPAGHPSSIQFYSTQDDSQIMEIEISPSNRVVSAGARIEPSRVEQVAFSAPARTRSKKSGINWMATLDVWEQSPFAPVRNLKFWQRGQLQTGFKLSTRIESPHDGRINFMSFSPSFESPILLTTSSDNSIKLWSLIGEAWQCSSSVSYRSFEPLGAAWCQDGSMFAVAHARCVTLWSLTTTSVIHSFLCSGIAPVLSVHFMENGAGETCLLAGGSSGTIAWNLLDFEKTFDLALRLESITPKPNSNLFIATEKAATSSEHVKNNAFMIDTLQSTISTHSIPYSVQQTTWLSEIQAHDNKVSFALASTEGKVAVVGSISASNRSVNPSRLPSISSGQSRLFDEIFGTGGEKSKPRPEITPLPLSGSVGQGLALLDAPAHALPPVHLLWKDMLGSFASVSSGENELSPRENVVESDTTKSERVSSMETPIAYSQSPFDLIDIFRSIATDLDTSSKQNGKVLR